MLSIICVLIAIVLAICLSAKRHGQDSACLSNLRQTGLALSLYISDYDDHYPTPVSAVFKKNSTQSAQTWRDLLVPYIKAPSFPQCPIANPSSNMDTEARQIDLCGYAYNQRLSLQTLTKTSKEYFGRNDSQIAYPSITVSLFDARPGVLALRGPDIARSPESLFGIWRSELLSDIMNLPSGASRHHGGANYGMADGHITWLQPGQVNSQRQSDGVRPGFGL